jgi:hypothetical protein
VPLEARFRLLEYPLTLVRLRGELESATEIFVRLNSGGVGLSPTDLDNARNPAKAHNSEANLETLADRLTTSGFGAVPPEIVQSSMEAIRGRGPDIADPDLLPADTERALAVTISWLRDEAAIPHLAVWQRHLGLLPTLARFFHLNRAPSARARILLRRWVWRVMGDNRAISAVSPEVINGQDSTDVSHLLAGVSASRPGRAYLSRVGQKFALSALGPASLASGERLDVPVVLEAYGQNAFRPIAGETLVLSPPGEGPLEDLLSAAMARPEVLPGHALDREVLTLLFDGDPQEFHKRRRWLLADNLLEVSEGLAEWGLSDRPAIADLIVSDDQDSHAG